MSEQQSTDMHGENIAVVDVLIIFAKHKWLILGWTLTAAVVSTIVAFSIPNTYTAATRILPPQQSQSAASAMVAQQLGSLAGLAGMRSSNDVYVAMLKSRTIADSMIKRFSLHVVFGQQFESDTRAVLEGMTRVVSGKDGIITIEVDDRNPKRAAELANAYVEELYKLTNVLAVTDASKRRLFFERQLSQARDSLSNAEIAARKALEIGGVVQVEGQGRAMIESTARLRGEISVKEVQIGAMRAFATEQNPELLASLQQLDAMKRELAKIEGTQGAVRTNIVASETAENKGFNSLRLLRDLKYQETVYELLAKQYEMAKIDEAKDSSLLQVMDRAIEPDRKSKPSRRLLVTLSIFAVAFLSMVMAIILEAVSRAGNDPEHLRRVALLRAYLIGKRNKAG